jgi:LuxR family transcriptional regulator, quorum-sensing system regulator SolR
MRVRIGADCNNSNDALYRDRTKDGGHLSQTSKPRRDKETLQHDSQTQLPANCELYYVTSFNFTYMHALDSSHLENPHLLQAMQMWLRGLHELHVVAGLIAYPSVTEHPHHLTLAACHPPSFTQSAAALLQQLGNDEIGQQSDRWVGFVNLNSATDSFRTALLDSGYKSMAWIAMPLPMDQRINCFFFGSALIYSKDQLATLTLSVLANFPKIKGLIANYQNWLTTREKECIRLGFAGATAKEMAVALGCTERTANYHMTNVMNKLGVNNKMAAAQFSCWLGII